MLEWPSICWMTFRSVREANARVAAPWRRSCKPDRRQAKFPDQGAEPVGEVLGPDRPTVGVGEHRPPLRQPGPVRARESGQRWSVNWCRSSSTACRTAWSTSLRVPCLVQGDGPAAGAALRRPAVQLPRQRDELPGDGELAGLGVEVVAVQGGGLAAAQAAQRDQPPQRGEPVVFHSHQEGDELPQGPDGDRRADAVAPPGLDPLGGPDDRMRPHRLVQADLGERVGGDEAFADGGVQRRPQRGADPVDGGGGDQRAVAGALAGEQAEAGLQPLAAQVAEGDPADAGDEVPVDVVTVAVHGRRAQVRFRLRQPVPQPPRHRPCARRGFVGRAVEDGLPGGDGGLPGWQPAAPVAGLPPADRSES